MGIEVIMGGLDLVIVESDPNKIIRGLFPGTKKKTKSDKSCVVGLTRKIFMI